jgi:hypothetical protein
MQGVLANAKATDVMEQFPDFKLVCQIGAWAAQSIHG